MSSRSIDGLNTLGTEARLLSREESWFEKNLQRPFYEACIADVYQPVSNAANSIAKPLVNKDLIPHLEISSRVQSASGPVEYIAQLLSRGAVGALTYSICGRASGGVLRMAGRLAHLEGPLAKLVASESSSMIVGAGIHDYWLDAKDNRERAANVAGGVSSFAVFEALNKKLPGLSKAQKALALAPIGALGGSTGYLARELTLGQSPDFQTLKQSALDGAALNLLLPAAQHGTARLIDRVNVSLGRGIPVERFMNYAEISNRSRTLDKLADNFALSRVQATIGAARINHRSDIIYLAENKNSAQDYLATDKVKSHQLIELLKLKPNPDFESGQKLAHELSHKESRKTQLKRLEPVSRLLDKDPDSARKQYIELRFLEELEARRTEEHVRREFNAKINKETLKPMIAEQPVQNMESVSISNELEKSYRAIFSNDYQRFERSGGNWLAEQDFALLSSEELGRLRQCKDSLEVVSKLYPELSEFERKGIAQVLSEAADANKCEPYELIFGMPLKAWRKALAWETAGQYLEDKLNSRNHEFQRKFSEQPAAKELARKAEEMEQRLSKIERQRLQESVKNYFESTLKALTRFADEQLGRETQARSKILELPSEFRNRLKELESERDAKILNAKNEYNETLSKLNQCWPAYILEGNPAQMHHGFQDTNPTPSLLDFAGADRSYKSNKEFLFHDSDFPTDGNGDPHPVTIEYRQIEEQLSALKSKYKNSFAPQLQEIFSTLTHSLHEHSHMEGSSKEISAPELIATSGELIRSTVESNNGSATVDPLAEAERLRILNWTNMRGKLVAAEADFNSGLNQLNADFDQSLQKKLSALRSRYLNESEHSNAIFFGRLVQAKSQLDYVLGRESSKRELAKQFAQLSKSYAPNLPLITLDINDPNTHKIMKNALSTALSMGKMSNTWYERGPWIDSLDSRKKISLPISSSSKDTRLRSILLSNLHQPAYELEDLAKAWKGLSEEKREQAVLLPYKDFVDSIAAQLRYPDARHPDLATEAVRWNLDISSYEFAEDVYSQSLQLPEPFPIDQNWTSSKYTGRFLPRADVRRLFMGNHTGSCMRIDGANEEGVIWAQTSPDAGFFVVENSQSGEIVAASRVWQVPAHKAICFNSIQAKGIGKRAQDILSIYTDAAQDLLKARNLEKIVVGTDHTKVSLKGLKRNKMLVPLPEGYDGLSDCEESQKILACTNEFKEKNKQLPMPARESSRLQGNYKLIDDKKYGYDDSRLEGEPWWLW